jgi:16S rRNA (guanine527-N7)-methyltransferase
LASAADHAAVKAVLPAWLRSTDALISGLETYGELLRRWNETQNLVSRETIPEMWSRHFADSLQVLRLLDGPPGQVLDLGSGGGLPAIPLALACPQALFTLVDSNAKKAAFLRAVTRTLDLNIEVLSARVEVLDLDTFPDVELITARAFAPLIRLLGYCAPLWREHTRGLFHKGREYGEEVTEALAHWRFHLVEHPSIVDSGGVILDITHLEGPDFED